MMARITGDRLVQHLTASGFVLMKGTAAAAPSPSAMPLQLNPTAFEARTQFDTMSGVS